jgi:hypothetical protein
MRVSIAVNRASDPTSSSVISEVLLSASSVLWSCLFCPMELILLRRSEHGCALCSLYKSWERGSQTAEPSARRSKSLFPICALRVPRGRYMCPAPGVVDTVWACGKPSTTGWSCRRITRPTDGETQWAMEHAGRIWRSIDLSTSVSTLQKEGNSLRLLHGHGPQDRWGDDRVTDT